MKLAVAGIGYVGLSNAILLAQKNEVVAVDVAAYKVDKVNDRLSPIMDVYIQNFLSSQVLNLRATTDKSVYEGVEFVIIVTPTDYDPKTNS
ncbi:hypothetical protein A134_00565 [Vibrio crassostreae 9CS106]|nr:hypothetical protein A134_00565 [Vibrio crassostreae 9CS106]